MSSSNTCFPSSPDPSAREVVPSCATSVPSSGHGPITLEDKCKQAEFIETRMRNEKEKGINNNGAGGDIEKENSNNNDDTTLLLPPSFSTRAPTSLPGSGEEGQNPSGGVSPCLHCAVVDETDVSGARELGFYPGTNGGSAMSDVDDAKHQGELKTPPPYCHHLQEQRRQQEHELEFFSRTSRPTWGGEFDFFCPECRSTIMNTEVCHDFSPTSSDPLKTLLQCPNRALHHHRRSRRRPPWEESTWLSDSGPPGAGEGSKVNRTQIPSSLSSSSSPSSAPATVSRAAAHGNGHDVSSSVNGPAPPFPPHTTLYPGPPVFSPMTSTNASDALAETGVLEILDLSPRMTSVSALASGGEASAASTPKPTASPTVAWTAAVPMSSGTPRRINVPLASSSPHSSTSKTPSQQRRFSLNGGGMEEDVENSPGGCFTGFPTPVKVSPLPQKRFGEGDDDENHNSVYFRCDLVTDALPYVVSSQSSEGAGSDKMGPQTVFIHDETSSPPSAREVPSKGASTTWPAAMPPHRHPSPKTPEKTSQRPPGVRCTYTRFPPSALSPFMLEERPAAVGAVGEKREGDPSQEQPTENSASSCSPDPVDPRLSGAVQYPSRRHRVGGAICLPPPSPPPTATAIAPTEERENTTAATPPLAVREKDCHTNRQTPAANVVGLEKPDQGRPCTSFSSSSPSPEVRLGSPDTAEERQRHLTPAASPIVVTIESLLQARKAAPSTSTPHPSSGGGGVLWGAGTSTFTSTARQAAMTAAARALVTQLDPGNPQSTADADRPHEAPTSPLSSPYPPSLLLSPNQSECVSLLDTTGFTLAATARPQSSPISLLSCSPRPERFRDGSEYGKRNQSSVTENVSASVNLTGHRQHSIDSASALRVSRNAHTPAYRRLPTPPSVGRRKCAPDSVFGISPVSISGIDTPSHASSVEHLSYRTRPAPLMGRAPPPLMDQLHVERERRSKGKEEEEEEEEEEEDMMDDDLAVQYRYSDPQYSREEEAAAVESITIPLRRQASGHHRDQISASHTAPPHPSPPDNKNHHPHQYHHNNTTTTTTTTTTMTSMVRSVATSPIHRNATKITTATPTTITSAGRSTLTARSLFVDSFSAAVGEDWTMNTAAARWKHMEREHEHVPMGTAQAEEERGILGSRPSPHSRCQKSPPSRRHSSPLSDFEAAIYQAATLHGGKHTRRGSENNEGENQQEPRATYLLSAIYSSSTSTSPSPLAVTGAQSQHRRQRSGRTLPPPPPIIIADGVYPSASVTAAAATAEEEERGGGGTSTLYPSLSSSASPDPRYDSAMGIVVARSSFSSMPFSSTRKASTLLPRRAVASASCPAGAHTACGGTVTAAAAAAAAHHNGEHQYYHSHCTQSESTTAAADGLSPSSPMLSPSPPPFDVPLPLLGGEVEDYVWVDDNEGEWWSSQSEDPSSTSQRHQPTTKPEHPRHTVHPTVDATDRVGPSSSPPLRRRGVLVVPHPALPSCSLPSGTSTCAPPPSSSCGVWPDSISEDSRCCYCCRVRTCDADYFERTAAAVEDVDLGGGTGRHEEREEGDACEETLDEGEAAADDGATVCSTMLTPPTADSIQSPPDARVAVRMLDQQTSDDNDTTRQSVCSMQTERSSVVYVSSVNHAGRPKEQETIPSAACFHTSAASWREKTNGVACSIRHVRAADSLGVEDAGLQEPHPSQQQPPIRKAEAPPNMARGGDTPLSLQVAIATAQRIMNPHLVQQQIHRHSPPTSPSPSSFPSPTLSSPCLPRVIMSPTEPPPPHPPTVDVVNTAMHPVAQAETCSTSETVAHGASPLLRTEVLWVGEPRTSSRGRVASRTDGVSLKGLTPPVLRRTTSKKPREVTEKRDGETEGMVIMKRADIDMKGNRYSADGLHGEPASHIRKRSSRRKSPEGKRLDGSFRSACVSPSFSLPVGNTLQTTVLPPPPGGDGMWCAKPLLTLTPAPSIAQNQIERPRPLDTFLHL